jgi:hypothetical protein
MPAKKNLGGRPPYQPTEKDRRFVEAMAACGFPQATIAKVLNCSHVTLRKHFQEILEVAKIQADAKVAGTLFQMATSGQHIAATIFWMKTQLHWKDTPAEVRFVDADGKDRDLTQAKEALLAEVARRAAGSGTTEDSR